MYRALPLTGVAGVGKSTVADAIGRALTTAGRVTAVVDTDMLAQFGPPPSGTRERGQFYDELKCANLAAVWANYKAVGARFIIVAAVIDSLALRKRYADSLADCRVCLVRLTANEDTIRRRLQERDTGSKLERRLRTRDAHRLESTTIVVEDSTVVNDRAVGDVAAEVLIRTGWPVQTGEHQS